MRAGRRLPDLGPRGEGWFLVQLVILAAIALAGTLGPAWSGAPRALAAVGGAVLIGAGGLLAVRGLVDLGGNLTPFPKPRAGGALVDTGAYSLVRHPIYGGLILGGVGWGLLTASPVSLAAAVILAAFFDLKSRREEAWLIERFDGYAGYRDRTRRLLPWLY
ncbi:MAG: isoprenylcysteine carboxylmethyltransferase family protein [Chloroflexi bacterium]|nr:isoprenylcysteine carboxylmethyltransferase family protein [Chloroflexota bacterium]